MTGEGGCWRHQFSTRPKDDEWIGVFEHPGAEIPEVVYQGREARLCTISNQPQPITFTERNNFYFVMQRSRTLGMFVGNGADGQQLQHNFHGFITRIRIKSVVKGPEKKVIFLYYGRVRDLDWDPARLA
jgi:hypothetical protein